MVDKADAFSDEPLVGHENRWFRKFRSEVDFRRRLWDLVKQGLVALPVLIGAAVGLVNLWKWWAGS